MYSPFSRYTLEDAAAALRHIPDADDRRVLLRILCGSPFSPLTASTEPAIDWDAQPPWAVYAAMDADGAYWLYNADVYPDCRDGAWTAKDEPGILVERMVDPPDDWIGDWCESRRVRPGTPQHELEMK